MSYEDRNSQQLIQELQSVADSQINQATLIKQYTALVTQAKDRIEGLATAELAFKAKQETLRQQEKELIEAQTQLDAALKDAYASQEANNLQLAETEKLYKIQEKATIEAKALREEAQAKIDNITKLAQG